MTDGLRKRACFAIVRLDDNAVSESQVTVKEIVGTEVEANAEVERLNAARRDSGYRYVWQATRWVERGQ